MMILHRYTTNNKILNKNFNISKFKTIKKLLDI